MRKESFMKKFIKISAILCALCIVLTMTGCGSTKKAYADEDDAPKTMTIVDSTNGYTIYRHDETGVHYFCRDAGYGKSVCVMLNPDGTPYTGEKE